MTTTASTTQASTHTSAPATGAATTATLPDDVAADRTATTDPILPPGWGELLGEIERRNRHQLLPHYITAGLILLAQAIHEMARQAETLGTAALVAGAACAAGGMIGHWWLRRRHELLGAWSWWAGLVSAAAATWMVLAVLSGITWGSVATALALDVAAGARWWRLHRHQAPDVEPEEMETPLPEDHSERVALFVQRWAEHIAGQGGALPGSVLLPAGEFEHGLEFTLMLARGRQDLALVQSVMSKLATGLGWPQRNLIAEHFPVEEATSDEELDPARVRLRIVLDSPIRDDVFFRRPRFTDGNILLGPYADGLGEALWRLYSANSMWGGMVIGGTGSGKSRLLEVIGLVAMWTGYTYVIHLDGQDGSSCPALWRYAHERYGRADTDMLLARLEAMKDYRQKLISNGEQEPDPEPESDWEGDFDTASRDELPQDTVSGGGFQPTAAFPGVLIIVDETNAVLDKKNAKKWSTLARQIRKVGMGIVMGDQDGTLTTFIESVLRGSLMAGNVIGLKTKERSQGQILSGGAFNLADLPQIPGFGYTLADTARHAPFRGQFLPSQDDVTEAAAKGKPIPDDVRTVGQWYRHVRHTRACVLDAGTLAAGDATAVQTTTARPTTTTPLTTAGRKLRRMFLPQVGVPTPATAKPPAASGVMVGGVVLTDTARRVLDSVRAGMTMPGEIAAHLDLSRETVRTALTALLTAGLVTKEGAGKAVRYETTAQGRVA